MISLELLAPARNKSIGIAAIDCGADAVYIAGPSFGARKDAGNSVEDIAQLCQYAHRFGARVFAAVNTILYDNELARAEELVFALQDAGVDALIVQDMALLSMLATEGNDSATAEGPASTTAAPRRLTIPLHASTQCAIRTPQRARDLEMAGFSRLILERQLSLKEIAQIRAAVSPAVELEFFVHGALCVSYSGQCYLSEALCGRSANRGACVQACRSRYNVFDGQGREILHDKAVLSLKDYSLLEHLEDLLSVGISSFKIEGRLKNESYVRNVVAAYSRALDACIARHPEKYVRASYGRSQAGFQPDIQRTFHRSYTDLYLRGEKGSWAAMDIPKGMGAYVGSLLEIGRCSSARSSGGSSGRSSAANSYIRLTSIPAAVQFAAGDGLSYVASNGDVEGFRIDNVQGDKLFCRVPSTLYKGARLYRNLDFAFEKQLASATSGRLLAVELSLECHLQDSDAATPNFEQEETWMLKASARSEDGREAICEKVFAAPFAQNQERMRGLIEAQLSKQTDIYRCRFVPSVSADFPLEDSVAGASSQDASLPGAFPQDASSPGPFPLEASSQRLLPLLSASTLNAIRRELCEKLEAQPCRALPLYKASEAGKVPLRDTSYKSNIANHKAFAQSLLVSASPSAASSASASSAVPASSSAASTAASADSFPPAVPSLQAFELCHQGDAELMRTRYCLRYELGICPRQQQVGASSAPLYLENNGRRFRLDFDCRNCEMILRSEDPKSGINEKL